MSNSIDKLINIAKSEVGYLEKASNKDLDDKLANAGYNNFTKYGRDLVKEIGSPYANGVAWCDMFVDWCFIQAFGKEKAKELLGGWSAYTPTSASYFKTLGQWAVAPKVGDVIFFKNSTRICHTGIVIEVMGNTIHTIEGNTSSANGVVANGGGVFKKSYQTSNSRIAGYGRPQYEENSVIEPTKSQYVYGIDVSEYQGNIDFKKVKADGKQFVIMRSTKKSGDVDRKFFDYLKGCKENHLDYACYKYSYATSEVDAVNEALSVIKMLNNERMMIWLDLEDKNQLQKLGKGGITKIANAFLTTCQNAGYNVGIYCNLNWYQNYIDSSLKKKYEFWIARYGKNTGKLDEAYRPSGVFAWQYSSKGKVNGIVGDVDLDVIL